MASIDQTDIDRALWKIAVDLSTSLPGDVQFQRLVDAVAEVLPCDAVGLFRYQDEVLVPAASRGLAPELHGQTFNPTAHPRLASILGAAGPVRFAADCSLPDPFDGLLDKDSERTALVHACMGCPLHIDGQLVGALTLDALDAAAFDHLADSTVAAFAALAAASMRNVALIRALEQAGEHQRAVARELIEDARRREGVLIGRGAAMQVLRQEIRLVAKTDLSVLISGETGTGKELVARTVHALSTRADQVLVQINCAALPESVAESELFGHCRGAFTGAMSDRAGKFELAHGGTLFLDEIGELPLALQPKLLRALQQGEIQRVGADRTAKVDVRVIAATNRDLAREVELGRFRADLYHRLNVYPIRVPALREHREDIASMTGYFLQSACHRLGVSRIDLHPAALSSLSAYEWPGNARELEHLLLRASLRAWRRGGERVLLEIADLDLPQASPAATQVASARTPGDDVPDDGLREAVDAFQRSLITAALSGAGSWAAAARRLKLDRANLVRLARRLGITPPSSLSN